jgi:hypothetical protein
MDLTVDKTITKLGKYIIIHKYIFENRTVLKNKSGAPMAHACNSSYSGGRDQEDCGSEIAQANSFVRSIFKKSFTTKGW